MGSSGTAAAFGQGQLPRCWKRAKSLARLHMRLNEGLCLTVRLHGVASPKSWPCATTSVDNPGHLHTNDAVRSRVSRLPSFVLTQTLPAQGSRSDLVLCPHNLENCYDSGLDCGRVQALLAASDDAGINKSKCDGFGAVSNFMSEKKGGQVGIVHLYGRSSQPNRASRETVGLRIAS